MKRLDIYFLPVGELFLKAEFLVIPEDITG
jgi:hypothetical protein